MISELCAPAAVTLATTDVTSVLSAIAGRYAALYATASGSTPSARERAGSNLTEACVLEELAIHLTLPAETAQYLEEVTMDVQERRTSSAVSAGQDTLEARVTEDLTTALALVQARPPLLIRDALIRDALSLAFVEIGVSEAEPFIREADVAVVRSMLRVWSGPDVDDASPVPPLVPSLPVPPDRAESFWMKAEPLRVARQALLRAAIAAAPWAAAINGPVTPPTSRGASLASTLKNRISGELRREFTRGSVQRWDRNMGLDRVRTALAQASAESVAKEASRDEHGDRLCAQLNRDSPITDEICRALARDFLTLRDQVLPAVTALVGGEIPGAPDAPRYDQLLRAREDLTLLREIEETRAATWEASLTDPRLGDRVQVAVRAGTFAPCLKASGNSGSCWDTLYGETCAICRDKALANQPPCWRHRELSWLTDWRKVHRAVPKAQWRLRLIEANVHPACYISARLEHLLGGARRDRRRLGGDLGGAGAKIGRVAFNSYVANDMSYELLALAKVAARQARIPEVVRPTAAERARAAESASDAWDPATVDWSAGEDPESIPHLYTRALKRCSDAPERRALLDWFRDSYVRAQDPVAAAMHLFGTASRNSERMNATRVLREHLREVPLESPTVDGSHSSGDRLEYEIRQRSRRDDLALDRVNDERDLDWLITRILEGDGSPRHREAMVLAERCAREADVQTFTALTVVIMRAVAQNEGLDPSHLVGDTGPSLSDLITDVTENPGHLLTSHHHLVIRSRHLAASLIAHLAAQ